MKKITIIFSLFIVHGLTNYACANESDFDEICKIYTEVLNSNMPSDQASNYVFDNISKRIHSKDALDAHDVIFQVAPASRYPIFKESVEHTYKKKWECDAMKVLMK